MADNTTVPIIIQGNTYTLSIPLQYYFVDEDHLELDDYTPAVDDVINVQLQGEQRTYSYAPVVSGTSVTIELTGNELAGIYNVIVIIVKSNGQKMRSNRSNQFIILDRSDDLTPDDLIEDLEENIIYLNTAAFIVGNGRGISSIDLTSSVGLVDTYTITYSDGTTSTYQVTNGTSSIVNDLTTGGIDKALSAEQGKVIGELLTPHITTAETQISGTNTGSGLYINVNTAEVTGGATTTRVKYFPVTEDTTVKLAIGIKAGDTPSNVIAAAAWFTTAPSTAGVSGTLAINDPLPTAVGNSPFTLNVPTGATYLGVSVRTDGGTAELSLLTDALDVASQSDFNDLADDVAEIGSAVSEVTHDVYIQPEMTTISGNVYLGISQGKIVGALNPGHAVDYCECNEGDEFVVTFNGDFTNQAASVGMAYWYSGDADNPPTSGSLMMAAAIEDGGSAKQINSVNGTFTQALTAPSGATHLCVQTYYYSGNGGTTSVLKKVARIDPSKIVADVQWNVPSVVYAVVGKEKRLYLDDIVNDYDSLILGLPEGHSSSVQLVKNYITFTPASAGDTSVTIDAFNRYGAKVGSKTITIRSITNALPENARRVCIIGDSGTDIQNMAYYMENEFKRMFGDNNSALPIFCGTRIYDYQARYYGQTNDKTTRYEAHYGRSYSWLATNASSPLVNGGVLDIANWRTGSDTLVNGVSQGCGLGAYDKIDVVSFAMGANDTADDAAAASQISALKSLIAAFRADNADTKFVIQLITLLGTDTRVEKLNSRFRFRELVLTDEDFAADNDIIIGDMGCCYDRWFAYRREDVCPAPCYPSDGIERIKVASNGGYSTNDTQHPTAEGSQQLGEAVVPTLLQHIQTLGDAAGETITTYTPTAVVVPTPLTLHSLNESKADKRTLEIVTATYDLIITDNGDPFSAQELSDTLDIYLDGWEEEPAALALYNEIVSNISPRTITGANTSKAFASALSSVSVDFDSDGKDAFDFDNYDVQIPTLATDNYVDYGNTSSVSPTLPNTYSRTDEFLFTFVVGSSWGSVTLPSGVVMADGFDWSEAAAGVTFQVSIQDGVCAYLCVTPNS